MIFALDSNATCGSFHLFFVLLSPDAALLAFFWVCFMFNQWTWFNSIKEKGTKHTRKCFTFFGLHPVFHGINTKMFKPSYSSHCKVYKMVLTIWSGIAPAMPQSEHSRS